MAFHVLTPRSPEWHAMRARHVGASEVACLFDAQADYSLSRYALWHVKAGTAPPPVVEGERIDAGVFLEPAIAAMAAARRGWTIRPGRYATDDACPGLGASLDFGIDAPSLQDEACEGPGVLETKNVDYLVWKRTWTGDEPPVHQLLQLMSQLACSGYQWGALAGLVGGNDLHIRIYKRANRERIIASIRERTTAFWQSVRDNKPPVPDGSDGASAVIRSLFPETVREAVDLSSDNELPELCADYTHARADAAEAGKRMDELRNRILERIGPHELAHATGFRISQSVTPAKPDRAAEPGEIIRGRAEARRLTIKETVGA